MALTAKKALGAAKKYTDLTVAGGGAIEGKNCVITDISEIPATVSKPAGQRVTFQWTLDDGTVETDTMDVFDGFDGASSEEVSEFTAESDWEAVFDHEGMPEDTSIITASASVINSSDVTIEA